VVVSFIGGGNRDSIGQAVFMEIYITINLSLHFLENSSTVSLILFKIM
jgi:hypothetical protein